MSHLGQQRASASIRYEAVIYTTLPAGTAVLNELAHDGEAIGLEI